MMKLSIKKFDKFYYGFPIGIILPVIFIYVYIKRFYPSEEGIFEILSRLYPSIILGKLLILSVMPDLLFVFLFYKSDTFKVAVGCLTGAILYIIFATFML